MAGVGDRQNTAEPAVDAEVLWVDPRELIIGDNVRTDVTLNREFVADIKDRGVRQVIPVCREESGRLVVQTGQKRVLAAIDAGLDRVRVLVETHQLSDERDRRIDRILDQLAENEHRSGITDADEARATQQLLGLGLTAGQIARRRHIATKRVKTAAAVAQNQVAMDAVAEGVLDLAQAAVVADFANDETAVVRLTTAASTRPEQFDHIAQQLRDDREQARLRTELTAALTEQNVMRPPSGPAKSWPWTSTTSTCPADAPKSSPKAGTPNGSTGHPAPRICCPACSAAAEQALCSSPTAAPHPRGVHPTATCAQTPEKPAWATTAPASCSAPTPAGNSTNSAATHLGEHNVPLQTIMAKTRHRNPRTAMRYIRPSAEAVAHITEELLDLGRHHP